LLRTNPVQKGGAQMKRQRKKELAQKKERREWVRLVDQFERSGMDQKTFASRNKVKLGTFQSWLYRLRREKRNRTRAKKGDVRLVRVEAKRGGNANRIRVSPDGGGNHRWLEVAVGHDVVLRFSGDTDSDYIGAVVSAVARDLSC
jgi:hypothetical protein